MAKIKIVAYYTDMNTQSEKVSIAFGEISPFNEVTKLEMGNQLAYENAIQHAGHSNVKLGNVEITVDEK